MIVALLQSPDLPHYFDAAWRARFLLKFSSGRQPDRDELALVVNSAIARSQDQLHIHVGCLRPSVQRAIAAAAPRVPVGRWQQLGGIVPHETSWGTRVGGMDLAEVEPFRLAVGALVGKVTDLRKAMIMVDGICRRSRKSMSACGRCAIRKPICIDTVSRKKQSSLRVVVMFIIGSRALADIERPIIERPIEQS